MRPDWFPVEGAFIAQWQSASFVRMRSGVQSSLRAAFLQIICFLLDYLPVQCWCHINSIRTPVISRSKVYLSSCSTEVPRKRRRGW